MSNQDEICKRFWHRIYHLERRGLYSYYEINKLVKDIEVIKDQVPLSKLLQTLIDRWYERREDADLSSRMQIMTNFKFIFHNHLKKIDKNPFTTVRKNKLHRSNKRMKDKINSHQIVE